MCRHLARIGAVASLADVLVTPDHSLHVQAYEPRRQKYGRINADGFGVGWYVEGRGEPIRYRRAQPMWTDQSFASLATGLRAECVLAAVRSATVGYPVEESCAAPFTYGKWLFSHNGRLEDYASTRAKLADRIADVPDAAAPVDSAVLFGLAVMHWTDGESLGSGLAATVADALSVADGRLNLLATDGDSVAATTHGDTLFTLETDDAVVVASEPYDDDPAWKEVPDRSLVVADRRSVTVTPLLWEPS